MKVERSLAEVVGNDEMGGGNYRLRLAIDGDWPESQPGQFLMLSAGAVTDVHRDDPLLPRPMAIYRCEDRPGGGVVVDVLYKCVGRGTGLMRSVTPGQSMRVVGPLGCGFPQPASGRAAVLVGGGTGIASLYDLARKFAASQPVVVLLGAQTGSAILGREDFEKLPVSLRLATDDGSTGHRGLVTELLGPALSEHPDAEVFACGPTPMMRAAADLCAERGVGCHVSLENNMACGVGICLGCAVPKRVEEGFAMVCRDGPVFDAGQLAWEGLP